MKPLLSTPGLSRRAFLGATAGAALAPVLAPLAADDSTEPFPIEPIIDSHQHTNYSGRSDQHQIAHQHALGITTTVLLPAGSLYGLDAQCGGNRTVAALTQRHPEKFVYFGNEVANLPNAVSVIAPMLRAGACGIGEQKFQVAGDSREIEAIAALAKEFEVPVLMHFQHEVYNTGIERFHKTLEKFPEVNFIGHAQTWWGNIDRHHDQTSMYPNGPVTPGGITDRLLADYPNLFGDLSAGSGLNSMIRDEDHARGFLDRHQDKLLYGSDCNDILGRGPGCLGAQILAAVRRLAPNEEARRKIPHRNAKRLLKL
jgi:predicted TIM-barrel fold metal-dependent hydrolase